MEVKNSIQSTFFLSLLLAAGRHTCGADLCDSDFDSPAVYFTSVECWLHGAFSTLPRWDADHSSPADVASAGSARSLALGRLVQR